MRIMVTGGAGFVGSHVVDHLIAAGHDVVVVDNLSTGSFANVNSKANLICWDLNYGVPPNASNVDAVVHCAAYADLRDNWKSHRKREQLERDNITATRKLLDGLDGVPIVFTSTASVYGSMFNFMKSRPSAEGDAFPWTCESPYAASKLACEATIAAYGFARGTPWKIVRLVNVVGTRTTHGVIGDFVRMYSDKGHIHAADNGKQRKSWVHVADVADAIIALLGNDIPNGTYNVTSGERISWWDIIDEMGVPRDEVTYEERAGGAIGDPVDLWVTGQKLAPLYVPHRSVMEGVREALMQLQWQRPSRAVFGVNP